MKGFPDLPPLWLLLFMAMAWALARIGPLAVASAGALQFFGGAVGLVGLCLIGWSAYWFRRRNTTIEPHHTPGALIVEGPYRISRNPIYLGLVLILTGQVLWLGALSPAALPPILLVILTERFVKPEEAALQTAFGRAAWDSMSATRRWI